MFVTLSTLQMQNQQVLLIVDPAEQCRLGSVLSWGEKKSLKKKLCFSSQKDFFVFFFEEATKLSYVSVFGTFRYIDGFQAF